jgi:hypothetical protein
MFFITTNALPPFVAGLAGIPAKPTFLTTPGPTSPTFDLQRIRALSAPGKRRIPDMKGSRASRSRSVTDPAAGGDVAERVERILATRNLTLSGVSRELRRRYPRMPHYLVPHNFYYDLGLPGYTPRIEQVLALSRISNYRLADWLTVFGFHLDDLPRLQAEFPSARTSLLDHTAYDRAAWVGWFRDVTGDDADPPAVAPLGRLLAPAPARRVDSLLPPEPSPFLYAKIGRQDAFAFPEVLPGSIVRADTRGVGELLESMQSRNSERLFLVEHGRGIVCCRLHGRTKGSVTLRASALPFAQTELRLGTEVRILGVLDLEFRPLKTVRPEVPSAFMNFQKPETLPEAGTRRGLRELLERARSCCGLSIRNASAKSRWIARALGDEGYFCAPGSLSEYERGARLPAHTHKVLSLCVLYSLGFWELLAAAGLDTGESGGESMPDGLVGRATLDSALPTVDPGPDDGKQPRFLSSLLAEFREIPLFLRHSLATVSGLPGISVRDVFWTGGRSVSLHPYLKDAVFVSVNRRLKKPVVLKRKSLWEQPLYVLLPRDGTCLVAGCSAEGSSLVVHPFADGFSRPLVLRNGVDAEVLGKVTALFRRLR